MSSIKDQLEFYYSLYKKSMEMNSKEEIKSDFVKMEILLKYMKAVKYYASLYLKSQTEYVMRREKNGKWFILPADRKEFSKALYRITRTKAVEYTLEEKLFQDMDLDGFYAYCEIIKTQAEMLYNKYKKIRFGKS